MASPEAGAIAKDITRALGAHASRIPDGPLKDAWAAAPKRLESAKTSGDVAKLYTDLRDATRFNSREISAGVALADLNKLQARIKGLTLPDEAPEDEKKSKKREREPQA